MKIFVPRKAQDAIVCHLSYSTPKAMRGDFRSLLQGNERRTIPGIILTNETRESGFGVPTHVEDDN